MMRNRIFRNLLYLAIFCSLLTFVAMSVFMYSLSYDQMKTEIKTETTYIAIAMNIDQDAYLTEIAKTSSINRITLIDNSGTVLFDTQKNASEMENHLDRPEIANAIATGTGEATRYSSTINQQTFYYAIKLDNGNILRVAFDTSTVLTALISGIPFIVLLMAVLMLITLVISNKQTNALLNPINTLNLDNPLANETYDDLAPLLIRIDQQKRNNDYQIQLLKEQHKEFDSITSNMQEGLIILSSKGSILSINKSACNIFSIANANATNQNFIVLNREDNFINTIQKALNGSLADTTINTNGRLYQLMANPVNNDDFNSAAVILLLDITEKQERENLRKEFSANVSHELKTPLTSIIGYAEIIQNGIAKTKDITSFAKQINDEAKQLLTLIDDIILLSHLDEDNENMYFENVDLYTVSHDVMNTLISKANKNNITLSLEGSSTYVSGIKNILYEMIFNLCDNAIKYNKTNGKVKIKISTELDSVKVEVSDTGIGIAKEHFDRLFERFYRVDTSHSRSTGGTGLGLSIVKNGAKLHNAIITFSSQENIGSTFTITFSKAKK